MMIQSRRTTLLAVAAVALVVGAAGHVARGQDRGDAEGLPLNAAILGWDETELAPFTDIDQAIRSPVLRACRVESQPFWINRRGIRSRWDNPYLETIGLEDFDQRTPLQSAIVVPLHMPFGQIAAAIFTSTDPAQSDLSREFARLGDALARLVRDRQAIIADHVSGET